jgi:putative phage-type endonuclease
MNRKQWLKERLKGIGGSEAAALFGLNPYINNVGLWKIKTGKAAEKYKENEFIKYGKAAEKHLINLFKLDFPQYKVIVPKPYTLLKNKEYPFILGTLDSGLKLGDVSGFLEIKTAQVYNFAQLENWNNKIPYKHYIQILHYFLLDDSFDFCVVKAQIKNLIDKDNIKISVEHYTFFRKNIEEDLKILLEKEKDFWKNYVLANKKPGD